MSLHGPALHSQLQAKPHSSVHTVDVNSGVAKPGVNRCCWFMVGARFQPSPSHLMLPHRRLLHKAHSLFLSVPHSVLQGHILPVFLSFFPCFGREEVGCWALYTCYTRDLINKKSSSSRATLPPVPPPRSSSSPAPLVRPVSWFSAWLGWPGSINKANVFLSPTVLWPHLQRE